MKVQKSPPNPPLINPAPSDLTIGRVSVTRLCWIGWRPYTRTNSQVAMYIDTNPNADKRLKLRYSGLSHFQTAYCRDAKYLELLLLAQTLHVSDILWCVSPDIIVSVRRTNFLGSQFLGALVWSFGLNAFLACTLVKRSLFSHSDEGALGLGMTVTLYRKVHPERRRTTRELENKRKPRQFAYRLGDFPNRPACSSPHQYVAIW
jgi:hypothetical protein